MMHDLRIALRALRRTPLFTVVAVLCLGLGLGANATVFGIVNAMLVRPLPFAEPGRLVQLSYSMPAGYQDHFSLSYGLDVLARSRSFAGAALWAGRQRTLTGRGDAETVTAAEASDSYFTVLGVAPLLGRGFVAGESRPGAAPVVVLNEAFWRGWLGADPGIVGQSLVLDGVAHTVVGVMPERVGLSGDREAMWTALPHVNDRAERGSHYLNLIARLREGVTVQAADAELQAIGRALGEEDARDRGFGARAFLLRDRTVPPQVVAVFAVMMGAVGLVLLIACANLANLLLARVASRSRELAVRTALGARRLRVVRLLLVEAALVAMAGAALGVVVAQGALAAMRTAIPVAYPRWLDFSIDWRVPAFAFALSLLAALAAGLVPALRVTSGDLAGSLRAGGRGATAHRGRLRNGLVVGALALSVVLLTGAGLLVRTVLHLGGADPGFDATGVLVARTYLGGDRYADPRAREAAARTLLERLAALPGVTAATVTNVAPMTGNPSSSMVQVEGRSFARGAEPSVPWRVVDAGYLGALRVPLVEGREFTAAEARDPGARVVIVNETLARRFWPGGSAVGRRIAFGGDSAAPRWSTIVGVARDVRQRAMTDRPELQAYRPLAEAPGRTVSFVLRTTGDAAALAPAVRREVAAFDAALPVSTLRTMTALVHESFWLSRLYGVLFGSFGVAALLMAVVGLYGVVAYAVAQRTREIGIRIALGARTATVERLVLREGGVLAGTGLVIGMVAAFGFARLLRGILHGVGASDPVVLGGVAATMVATALLATWLPARRAAHTDPLAALRAD